LSRGFLDPLFSIRSTVAPPLRSALCGQGSEWVAKVPSPRFFPHRTPPLRSSPHPRGGRGDTLPPTFSYPCGVRATPLSPFLPGSPGSMETSLGRRDHLHQSWSGQRQGRAGASMAGRGPGPVKNLLEDKFVVPGAGAFEVAPTPGPPGSPPGSVRSPCMCVFDRPILHTPMILTTTS